MTRRSLLFVAITGCLLCSVATLVSSLAAVGATPAFLFGYSSNLASLLRWRGLPVEFFGAVWFLGAILLIASEGKDQRRRGGVAAGLLMSAIPFVGLGAWLVFDRHFPCWPVLMATACATALLIGGSFDPALSFGRCFRGITEGARNPLARALALVSILAVLGLGEGIRLSAGGVSETSAHRRAFLTWYAARSASVPAEGAGRLRITVFTDYQCPACASDVPSIEGVVAEFRLRSELSVDLVLRDFPLDRSCNDSIGRTVHPAACMAAATVRLAHEERGYESGHELALWLYHHSAELSSKSVMAHLLQMGLADAFDRRRDELLRKVAGDAGYGNSLGIQATPTVIVNGVELPGSSLLEDALDFEAARAIRR